MIENPHSNESVEKQAGVNKFPRNINLFLQIQSVVHLNGMILHKFTTSVILWTIKMYYITPSMIKLKVSLEIQFTFFLI